MMILRPSLRMRARAKNGRHDPYGRGLGRTRHSSRPATRMSVLEKSMSSPREPAAELCRSDDAAKQPRATDLETSVIVRYATRASYAKQRRSVPDD